METTLKQCCDMAPMLALKKSNIIPTVQLANAEVELKTIIQLIEGNCLQNWNKISRFPPEIDINLLKDYLIRKANSASLELENNCLDERAYSTLLETAYCRLILLNRRRPGELQRLLIQTYESAFSSQNTQAYEEFSEVIFEALNNFKTNS
ncbi:hypothetical protein WA026_009331 [Henosepilachna vigintioctopunctata]|uniref:Uncharacterized protein n=1 Tax=Henosepilachna vigintioctopunctata TaxID=420089 RepID=A0AAW1UPK0_9CUCU